MKPQLLIDGQPVATLLEYELVDSETGDVLARRKRSTVEQFRVWQSTSKKRKR